MRSQSDTLPSINCQECSRSRLDLHHPSFAARRLHRWAVHRRKCDCRASLPPLAKVTVEAFLNKPGCRRWQQRLHERSNKKEPSKGPGGHRQRMASQRVLKHLLRMSPNCNTNDQIMHFGSVGAWEFVKGGRRIMTVRCYDFHCVGGPGLDGPKL